jgi:hypothetical protein
VILPPDQAVGSFEPARLNGPDYVWQAVISPDDYWGNLDVDAGAWIDTFGIFSMI